FQTRVIDGQDLLIGYKTLRGGSISTSHIIVDQPTLIPEHTLQQINALCGARRWRLHTPVVNATDAQRPYRLLVISSGNRFLPGVVDGISIRAVIPPPLLAFIPMHIIIKHRLTV